MIENRSMTDDVLQSPSLDLLTQEGERFYLEQLRKKLEEKHLGKYVIIEPKSKDYFIDDDLLIALQKAEKKHPDKFFTIVKVGTFKPPVNNYKRNIKFQGIDHAWAL